MKTLRDRIMEDSFGYFGDPDKPRMCIDSDDALAAFREWLTKDEAVLIRVATILNPLAFDPDPKVRHQHCSPVCVDAVQGDALRLAKSVLVEILGDTK